MSAQKGRKSALPSNAELAAMLRDGATLATLGERYGVGPKRIVVRLSAAGWGSDGQPNVEQKKPAELLPSDDRTWLNDALCAKVGNGDGFFAADEDDRDTGRAYLSIREAKETCAACPVSAKCLDYALKNDERFGIWAGLTYQERRRLTGLPATGHVDITKWTEIRVWALSRGMSVPRSGRISNAIIEAFHAAHAEAAS